MIKPFSQTSVNYIVLLEIDATAQGALRPLYFASEQITGTEIKYNNNVYKKLLFEIDKITNDVSPKPARPRLTIQPDYIELEEYIDNYYNLERAIIRLIVATPKNLNKIEREDIVTSSEFEVSSCLVRSDMFIQLEIKTILDLDGKDIPGLVANNTYCDRCYRIYNAITKQFDAPKRNPCPYIGTNYFTIDNVSTTNPALDKCAKTQKACEARFPTGEVPASLFPSIVNQ